MERFFIETRAALDGNTLTGYAAIWNSVAELPNHLERLAPSAFDIALRDSDAAALINHDKNLLIGRQSAGTLRLQKDRKGLAFEVDLPDTTAARDLKENIKNYGGMSFAFAPGEDKWSTLNGKQLRTHTSVKVLQDISIVTFPAFKGTEVMLRSYDFESRNNLQSQLIRARHGITMGVS